MFESKRSSRNWQPLGIALMLAFGVAHAEDGAAQKAVAKAQFMLRQAASEKAALQQQVSELQKQVDTLGKQLADVKGASGARQEVLSRQLASATVSSHEALEKIGGDLQATQQKLQASQQQEAQLEQKLQNQTRNFSQCYANNRKLYEINRELLGQYQSKGAVDALLQKEPFTGVTQVDVENLIQDYQYKLDDLKLPDNPGNLSANSPAHGEHSSTSGGGAAAAP